MRRGVRIAEGFEIRTPPLSEAVSNLPLCFAGDAIFRIGRKDLVQSGSHPGHFVFAWFEVISGQLEESIRDLQHENMPFIGIKPQISVCEVGQGISTGGRD